MISREGLALVNVRSLGTLFAVNDVERDLLPFGESLETIANNGAEMNENVLALVRCNETVPLAIVKPLHCSLTHPKTAS